MSRPLVTDAELTAMYGRGLHPQTAARLIDEIRRLRRELNDERVRNQHDRDLVGELSRRLAEVEADRDAWQRDFREVFDRAEAAEAYLSSAMRQIDVALAESESLRAKLAAVTRVRGWLGENNDDAEYDLAIVALNDALEGGAS